MRMMAERCNSHCSETAATSSRINTGPAGRPPRPPGPAAGRRDQGKGLAPGTRRPSAVSATSHMRSARFASEPSAVARQVRTPFPIMMRVGVIAVGVLVILAAFVGRDLVNGTRDRSSRPVVASNDPIAEWPRPSGRGPVAPSGMPSLPALPPVLVAKNSAAMLSAEEMQRNLALAMQKIEGVVGKVRQEQHG